MQEPEPLQIETDAWAEKHIEVESGPKCKVGQSGNWPALRRLGMGDGIGKFEALEGDSSEQLGREGGLGLLADGLQRALRVALRGYAQRKGLVARPSQLWELGVRDAGT